MTNSQGTIAWPDHISDQTLERMGLAIIERNESEQILQLYRITVWVKAISCISKLAPLISSQPLKLHFRNLKKQYETAAIDELNSIPLAASPSLTLLQALLSGVSEITNHCVSTIYSFLLETVDAIFREHVPLLDVHGPRFENYCRLKLPQHYQSHTPE